MLNFSVNNDWGTGFTGNLTITNTTNSAINGWTIEFDAPFQITHIWNAEIISQQGSRYRIRNLSWNQQIAPNSSISFGFNGAKASGTTAQISNSTLNGVATSPLTIPRLSVGDVSIMEGANGVVYAVFTVSLSAASTQPVTVNYGTANGSAIAGSDYTAANGMLSFAAGETRKTVAIAINPDSLNEATETFLFNLSNATNATIERSQATGSILNYQLATPDPLQLRINDVALSEGNSGTRNATFTVSLSRSSTAPVTVRFATANGTATAGSDYTAASGTLTFNPGELSKSIAVAVLGDTTVEANETFFVNLTSPTNATIGDSQGIATIQNDDVTAVLPSLTIGDVTVTEGNSGTTNAIVTVNLSAASTQTITVNFASANRTAIAGADYNAVSGRLTFAPGVRSQTIAIPVIGDTTVESSEAFVIDLSGAVGATIADAQALVTILDNDTVPGAMFNYGDALGKSILFYEAQRSGRLPSNRRVTWRGDSALRDGADVGVDLTGGYYDAGDHVKFGLPMAASMTMLSWGVVQYRNAYQQSGQLPYILDAIKWGTDYILKAHTKQNEFWGQVGLGDVDHAYWGPPETMTMQRPAFKIDASKPGSDLAGEAAAALASASIAFRSTDVAYADRLLQNAEQLFNFADTYRGKYSDSIPDAGKFYNSWSGYMDELSWSAAWLYEATQAAGRPNITYLNKAESYYSQAPIGGWTQTWDSKSYGAGVLLAQETGKANYKTDVENWLNRWSDRSGASGIQYTAGGLAWLDQWGSLRYAANTAFLAGIYADTVNNPSQRYSNFSRDQIEYMLGDNPQNRSYMVGFGNNSPKNPHHRASHGSTTNNISSPTNNRFELTGALVGGPSAPRDDAYVDDRSNYITNEVALDYNAGFTGALARLYGQSGALTTALPTTS
ncbi:MAG: glycoside hydrolase family 9 protein [Synechococcales bacterium]|nr:glycoside hydrolase family 9 protein [Synechococcales bacterium]